MDITSISDSWPRLVTDGGQLWLTVGGPVHPRGVGWGQSQLPTLLTEKTISLQDWLWLGVLSNGNRLKETLERRGWAQTMKAAIPHQTGVSMISYGLVRLRHIKHLLKVRKRLGFGFKYLVLSQQTWRRKTRKNLVKNIWFCCNKCGLNICYCCRELSLCGIKTSSGYTLVNTCQCWNTHFSFSLSHLADNSPSRFQSHSKPNENQYPKITHFCAFANCW